MSRRLLANMSNQTPHIYTIRLEGCLDARWSEWLGGLTIECTPDGETVLRGVMADQAALHGVLIRIRDLGVPVIEVRRAPHQT